MERKVHRIHTLGFEEIGRVVEGLLWCVPGQRQHVLLTVDQATAAVLLRSIRTGAAIARIQAAVTFGEDFIDVFLHGPWRAHPPAWHLVNDHIGP
ncbi:hypothetical protein D3C80_1374230 [compost metagenome]